MKDQEKQINILRSEASRLGYHGLPLEKFLEKAAGDTSLLQNGKMDELNHKEAIKRDKCTELEKRKNKLLKKLASLKVNWHDIASITAMIISVTGLSLLWQNLIWGNMVYQGWIAFGFVITCVTTGALVNEYAKNISDEDKQTLMLSLKIVTFALTFVFSLESLDYVNVTRSFILSCIAAVVVHGVNHLFMPVMKGLVKIVRFFYLSCKKWSINVKMRRCSRELYQLDQEIETIKHNNEVFVETTIRQLELDYMLGKSASMNPVKTDEIIDEPNITEEVAYA